jgi:hypothetical protein
LNQATAEHQESHRQEVAYTWFGLNQGPDRDRGTFARDTCEYYVNKDGRPVLGSLTCKRDVCIQTPGLPICYILYVISPTKPTGGVISPPPAGLTEEVSPGSGVNEMPPSIEPGDSGTENNTSQNTRNVPKTGILDEPGALSDDESAEDDDDTEVPNDQGGPNNDNGPTINPEEE